MRHRVFELIVNSWWGMSRVIIFLDGQMINADMRKLRSLAPGTIQGRGVFETMRVYNGEVFDFPRHFSRLSQGLKLLKVPLRYTKAKYAKYCDDVLKANALKEARVRLAVWKDDASSAVRIAIVSRKLGNSYDKTHKKGIKAIISEIKHKKTQFSHIKSINYACFQQAFDEAQARGVDEAILLNSHKEVVEGSRTNIFCVKGGFLYTPAVKCGCLNGITRQHVIQCARNLGMPMKISSIRPRQLFQCDEAFVTNSLLGVTPLIEVNKEVIGKGVSGPITKGFRRAYNTIVHSACPREGKSV